MSDVLGKVDGPVSVPEHAYSVLKNALLGGKLKPGDTLIQEDIASSLGFSRVPVREALKRLEGEGLVVQRPRRGYVVASLDADEVEDVFDVRMLLEERAGYLATQKRTDSDVAAVQEAFKEMLKIQARAKYDREGWGVANRSFHDRLFAPCNRPHLLRMLGQQRDLVTLYVRIGGNIAPDIERTTEDHRRILDAYERQDADEVARLSREHVEHTMTRLVSKLRELG
ncbi:GntR family transcriptional regulator [Rhizobium puerariae]|uniref:GntR family transcriptional regulator n=1 Tax=Rhizobium puerariae TaxID=1585791 RepID=A0ABV6A9Z2_9HYPH